MHGLSLRDSTAIFLPDLPPSQSVRGDLRDAETGVSRKTKRSAAMARVMVIVKTPRSGILLMMIMLILTMTIIMILIMLIVVMMIIHNGSYTSNGNKSHPRRRS